VLLSESRIQSSELQVEMREDVEALTVRLQEAGEQLCELKTRLVNVRETAAASKARSDCQVDKRDRDATIGALELQDASRMTELEAVKAELTCFSHVGSAPAEPHREREFMGNTRAEDRAVGADIVLTLSRLQSSPLGFQDPGQSSSQGLTALTQNVISTVEKPST